MARIIVVDDDADVRVLFSLILTDAGHHVIEASNGEEGTRLYREHLPDVIITDIIMPDKEGIETIRELRRDFPDAKIIAISGGGSALTGRDALSLAKHLGASSTLAKPFSGQELLDAVQELLTGGK